MWNHKNLNENFVDPQTLRKNYSGTTNLCTGHVWASTGKAWGTVGACSGARVVLCGSWVGSLLWPQALRGLVESQWLRGLVDGRCLEGFVDGRSWLGSAALPTRHGMHEGIYKVHSLYGMAWHGMAWHEHARLEFERPSMPWVISWKIRRWRRLMARRTRA